MLTMNYQDQIILLWKIFYKLNSISSNSLVWLPSLDEDSRWGLDAPHLNPRCHLAIIFILYLCNFAEFPHGWRSFVNEGESEEIMMSLMNFIQVVYVVEGWEQAKGFIL